MTEVIEMVGDWLKQHGFDGLSQPGVCGCDLSDLSPADCLEEGCRAGYKHTHSVTGDYVISESKEPMTDDEIDHIVRSCL